MSEVNELSNPHDSFFKEIFSRPEVARDFLQNYLPPAVVEQLDMASLELRKDSFVLTLRIAGGRRGW